MTLALQQTTSARAYARKARAVILALADLHSGHKFGLCPSGAIIYDEMPNGDFAPRRATLTAFQEMLLGLVERIVAAAVELAGDDPLYLKVLGDPTHGFKHPEQLMTTRLADQIEISVAALDLVISRLPTLKFVRLVVGTGAHEFGEGSATLLIARLLAAKYPHLDIRALYHGLADIAGAQVDYSHHGPGKGKRIWLAGNESRFYLRDICLRAVAAGAKPPHLVLRGHTHTLVNEVVTIELADGMFESRLIVCPPMCGMGDFARQVTLSAAGITVGAVLTEIIGGKTLAPEFIYETFDIRTKETL
jgi:hypothetical protein